MDDRSSKQMEETMKDNMTTKPTLVLGGTGKTGRRVAKRLKARGLPVRIGSRTAEPRFDWNDAATWAPVLQGVGAVYITYQPDLAVPGAVETVRSFTEAALEAGVRRMVLLSGRGEDEAQRAEQALQDIDADWTIVRATWFAQNFSEGYSTLYLLPRSHCRPGTWGSRSSTPTTSQT
jgi:uncharacterized protein YbjT (DUF2867 family)